MGWHKSERLKVFRASPRGLEGRAFYKVANKHQHPSPPETKEDKTRPIKFDMSNYIQDLEKELTARLEYARECVFEQKDWESWSADLVTYLKETVTASFKNGLEAAKNRSNRKSDKMGQPPRNLPTSPSRRRE